MQVTDNRKIRRFCRVGLALALVFLAGSGGARAEKTVDVFSSGKTLSAIFQSLAASSNTEIRVDPDVSGTLDLSLKGFPFTSALNAICSAANLEWEKAEASGDKDVYIVHRASREDSLAEDSEAAVEEPKTKVDFRTPAERAAAEQAATDSRPEAAASEDPTAKFKNVRELHLNAAQLRMVLGGVPPVKANSVLNYWRQQNSMNGPRVFQPGFNGYGSSGYLSGPGYGRYPYYPDARINRMGFNPDGSVWIMKPARQHHTTHRKAKASARR